jgi:hypothetical protein
VTLPAPEEQQWIIEPLLHAGLDLEAVSDLVVRLAFEGVVGGSAGDMLGLAADQPTEVQAAWWHALGRMISADDLE